MADSTQLHRRFEDIFAKLRLSGQNTAESYRICTLILEETQSKGKHVPRQAFFFAIALALKQVLLLGLSGALKDLLSFLESAIVADTPTFVKKPAFPQEVLETVREKMADSTQLHSRFEDIFAKLRLSGQVTDVTLDIMLCHTPNAKKKHAALLDRRRISRRTFRPLQSALLIE
ncbi:UNVERIFIED_CONTAM: hypothetical protein FKN15_007358 [Acipenser sinensis]